MYIMQWLDYGDIFEAGGVIAKVENPQHVEPNLIGTRLYGLQGDDMGKCRVNHRAWKCPPKKWLEKGNWHGHVARYDGDVFRIVYDPLGEWAA